MIGLHAREELPQGACVMWNRNRRCNNYGQQQPPQQQQEQPPQQCQQHCSSFPGVSAGGSTWDSGFVDAEMDDEDY
jgi:hypothetical protein